MPTTTATVANIYQPGDEVAIAFVITDNTGASYDPPVVKFHYKDAAGTANTKTYLTDSAVTKTSAGHYKLVIYVPYAAASVGDWYYDAQALDGSANSLLVEPGQFTVESIGTLA